MLIYALLVEEGLEEKVSSAIENNSSSKIHNLKEFHRTLSIPGHVFVRMDYVAENISFLKNVPGIIGFFLQKDGQELSDEILFFELTLPEEDFPEFFEPLAETEKDAVVEIIIQPGKATVNPLVVTHKMGSGEDIEFIVNPNGRNFIALNDGSDLVLNDHYKVFENTYTVFSSYLDSMSAFLQSKGVSSGKIVFRMDGGDNPEAEIFISPGNAFLKTQAYEHTRGIKDDLEINLSFNGRVLHKIIYDKETLREKEHYSLSDNTCKIFSSYLNGIETGDYELVFQMDGGVNPVAVIKIWSGEPGVIPQIAHYTRGSDDEIEVYFTANGRNLNKITCGESELVPGKDYSSSGEIYKFSGRVFEGIKDSNTELVFDTDGSLSPEVTVILNAGDATIEPLKTEYYLGSSNGIIYQLSPNGRQLNNIVVEGDLLKPGIDYSVSGYEYTILSSWISRKNTGRLNISFQMDEGFNPEAEINILPGKAEVDPSDVIYTISSGNNIGLNLILNGRVLERINDGNKDLREGEDYHKSENTYTILSSYLDGKDTGRFKLIFHMDKGANPFCTITVNAGEAIVKNVVSTYYIGSGNDIAINLIPNGQILRKISDGKKELIKDKDFTVNKNTYVILHSYLDSKGAGNLKISFEMDRGNPDAVIIIESGNAFIDPSQIDYIIGSGDSREINLTNNGKKLIRINEGTKELISGEDYVSENDSYRISSSYLNRKGSGNFILTFEMDYGYNPELSISISAGDSVVENSEAEYIKGSLTDIEVKLKENGRSFSSLSDRIAKLKEGKEYQRDGDSFIIKSSYLETLKSGSLNLKFLMSGGEDPQFLIKITPGDALLNQTNASFFMGSSENIDFCLQLNGRVLNVIREEDAILTENVDYKVSGDKYTILSSYLQKKDIGSFMISFRMDKGTDPVATINVDPGDAVLEPLSGNIVMGSEEDIEFKLTTNGRSLKSISDGSTIYPDKHYMFSGKSYIILSSYLKYLTAYIAGKEVDYGTLTFLMDGGRDPVARLIVKPGDAVIEPPAFSYIIGSRQNIPFILQANGRRFKNIKENNIFLKKDTDYTLSGNSFLLLSSYLENKKPGDIKLTFLMDGGNNPDVVLTIEAGEPCIDKTEHTYMIGSGEDIAIRIDTNGNTFKGIGDGKEFLTADKDYIIKENLFIISSLYFESIGVGAEKIYFRMENGNDLAALVLIKPGDASVEQLTAIYNLGSQKDINFDIDLKGNKLIKIKDNVSSLNEGEDYLFSGKTVKVLSTYLEKKTIGDLTLNFMMSASLDVNVLVAVKPGKVSIEPTLFFYTLGSNENLFVKTFLNGNKLLNIRSNEEFLSPGTDYEHSTDSCFIFSAFLEKMTPGKTVIIFDFENDISLKTTVVISAGKAILRPDHIIYNYGLSEDISIKLSKNGRNLKRIKVNGINLVEEDHYKESGDTYTFFSEFLDMLFVKLSKNEKKSADIIFEMDGGSPPTVEIKIESLLQIAVVEEIIHKKDEAVTESVKPSEREQNISKASLTKLKDPVAPADLNTLKEALSKKSNNIGRFKMPAVFLAVLILSFVSLYIYVDHMALQKIEPFIYVDNDKEWSGWDGLDHTIEEGIVSLKKREYNSSHIMYYFSPEEVPVEKATLKINMQLVDFTGNLYSLITVFSPGGSIALITDRNGRIGLMTGPQGKPEFSRRRVLTDEFHDIAIFLDQPRGEISAYVDGNQVVKMEKSFILYPLKEVWIGSAWIGGVNDMGVPLGHTIKSFELGDENLIFAGNSFKETLFNNFRTNNWLWILSAVAFVIILAVVCLRLRPLIN